MQRLRVRFSRGEEVRFISHLDIMRLWQRAFYRADTPLAYSEGFSPHPQISSAAPLAVGITSEAELMDILCTKVVSPHWLITAVNQQLPPGIEILQVHPIALSLPSLQSQVRYAEFQVTMATKKGQRDIEAMLANLLSKKQLPWQHRRDTGTRSYDLRALIDNLWLINWQAGTIGMRLRCDNSGAGRPEQVAAALGFGQRPQSIHRTKLILAAK